MTTVRLTRRGRVVRAIAIGFALLLTLKLLNDWATPAECQVDFEHLSKACVALLFPN